VEKKAPFSVERRILVQNGRVAFGAISAFKEAPLVGGCIKLRWLMFGVKGRPLKKQAAPLEISCNEEFCCVSRSLLGLGGQSGC